ncbi:hypothetical protein NA56DRAFT_744476 [Hyaloscypha hepaticicola]|uniref:Uncharacterized protein n=1 Tax=Hyaloscypha hepaticicola TaxID=2082293 RepID=A0A2J6QJ57_9HELO|nr:hypothetical protein NA56DRAFT_744476 [Hyaloscypha hepaticicola]
MPSLLSPYLHTFHIPVPHLQSQIVNKENTYLKLRHLHLQQLNSTQLNSTQLNSTQLNRNSSKPKLSQDSLHLFTNKMCQHNHTHKNRHAPSNQASPKKSGLVNYEALVGWYCCRCSTTVQYGYWTCPSTSCGHSHCEYCTLLYASAN